MHIAIVTESDFAGSGYFATEAIKSVQAKNGAFCRHIAYWPHPWGFPSDIVTRDPKETTHIFDRAQLIHLWNILPDDRTIGRLKVPLEKVKSITLTGSLYRKEYDRCNELIAKHGLKLVIQNPCFADHAPDATFIQHSLPKGFTRPNRARQNLIGVYDKHDGRGLPSKTTTGHSDAMFVKGIVENIPDWEIALEGPVKMWPDRMSRLAQCKLFFEYFDKNMGYWGRSTLEACALGVVPLTWWRPEMLNGLPDPPFPKVTKENIVDAIDYAIGNWNDLSAQCIEWVNENYNPAVVGRKYLDLFGGL